MIRYSSDPKKRYELFLKATQFDIIIEKLQSCSEHMKSTKGSLAAQQEISKDLKKKYDEAAMQISRLNSVNPIRVTIFFSCLCLIININI